MCEQMGLPSGAAERNKRVVPIYIGDDKTDEDAFELLRSHDRGNQGISIVVREKAPQRSETAAEFWLRQREVADFLALFLHDRVLIQMPDGGVSSGVGRSGSKRERPSASTAKPASPGTGQEGIFAPGSAAALQSTGTAGA